MDAELSIACLDDKICVEMRTELPIHHWPQQASLHRGGKPSRNRRKQQRKMAQEATLNNESERYVDEDSSTLEANNQLESPEPSIENNINAACDSESFGVTTVVITEPSLISTKTSPYVPTIVSQCVISSAAFQ